MDAWAAIRRAWGWARRGGSGRGRSGALRRRPGVEALEGRRLLSLSIREFTIPSQFEPGALTPGPDGNVWFTERVNTAGVFLINDPDKAGAVARITPDGTITEFPMPPRVEAGSLTAGADGNLYFTESTLRSFLGIFRINPSTGAISPLPLDGQVGGIADLVAGPGGDLWGIGGGGIDRISLSGHVTRFPIDPGGAAGSGIGSLTVGPDSGLWFSDDAYNDSRIGRLDPATGAVAEFHLPSGSVVAERLAPGPDGNVYFTEGLIIATTGNVPRVGRITPAGAITEFPAPVPSFFPSDAITAAPDGNIWYAGAITSNPPVGVFRRSPVLVRLTPAGTATVYPIPEDSPAGAGNPLDQAGFDIGTMTAGPDGKLYYGLDDTSFSGPTKIGQVVLPSSPAPPPVAPATPPMALGVRELFAPSRPTGLVVRFNEPLDPAGARDPGNYTLAVLGRRTRSGRPSWRPVRLAAATYDAATQSVTLSVRGRLNPLQTYLLTLDGTPGRGLTGQDGLPLLGDAGPGSPDAIVIPGSRRPTGRRR